MSDHPSDPGEAPFSMEGDFSLEDHEMPTRRIERVDPEALGLTQPSASRLEADPLGMTQPADDDDLSGVTRRTGTVDEGYRAVSDWYEDAPHPSPPPRATRRDEIPTRTYSTDLPYSVAPNTPPPIYGGFEDRPSRKRGRGKARERRDSGLYLPWWSLLILLGIVTFFAAFLFLGLNLLGGQFEPGGETPLVIVVTSTPTPPVSFQPTALPLFATPTVIAFPGVFTAAPTEALDGPPLIYSPVPTDIPQPDPNLELRLGATVAVLGTQRAGLNVRTGAGVGFDVLFIAPEDSRYTVIGGPEEADGFVWWQISDPQDATRQGWAVNDFLAVVP